MGNCDQDIFYEKKYNFSNKKKCKCKTILGVVLILQNFTHAPEVLYK